MKKIFHQFPFQTRITISYLIIGFSWIFFSDEFIDYFFSDELITHMQTIKGSLYIIATATLLYFFVKKNNNKILQANRLLAEKNDELCKANEELMIAKKEAEENNQLKTAFLQNMSHEIRTPMNAICGFSKMLNKPEYTEEKKKEFVSIINNSSNQLLSIVSDVLTMSSLETGQEKITLQKTFVNEILNELLAIYTVQKKNEKISLAVKTELPDHGSEILTDGTKLVQVLNNLITNALKYTAEGSVEFGCTLKETDPIPFLRFYVTDTGMGIEPGLQDKIFERFYQTGNHSHMNYGGTGLGLSISRGFVELLGGKIWVHSEPGKGSTFYFTIPYKPVKE